MIEKRKDQKAVMFYMPEIIHDAVKKACDEQGMTLTKYIIRSVVSRLNLERAKENKIKY